MFSLSPQHLAAPYAPAWLVHSRFFVPASWAVAVASVLAAVVALFPGARTALAFAYHCFLAPIGSGKNQSERLDRFYQGQAGGECGSGAALSCIQGLIASAWQSTMQRAAACCVAAARCSSECAASSHAKAARLMRSRRLCAAQLREMQRTNPGKPLVWVDIGGGTGERQRAAVVQRSSC